MNFIFGFFFGMALVSFIGLFNKKLLGIDSVNEAFETLLVWIILLVLTGLFINNQFDLLTIIIGFFIGLILGFIKIKVN